MNYLDLGYDSFGIKRVTDNIRKSPTETRNSYAPGSLISDGFYLGSGNDVIKTDKNGLFAGDNDWADAPFQLDPQGNIASDLSVTGDVIIAGMWKQGDTYHAFGGFQDSDYTLPVDSDTWTHMTNATNDLWTGSDLDGFTFSGDVMTFTNTGHYVGVVSLTFSSLTSKDYQIRLYNVTQGEQSGYEIGATGTVNFNNIVLPLNIDATAGDQFRMEMKCTTDGTDPILRSAIFNLTYLHE